MNEERLSAELLSMLGLEDFLRLVEAYGGTRLFVPASGERQELVEAIGDQAVETLARRYAGDQIRVPLARDARARQYRAEGLSNAQIARRLGIAETSVNKLFRRMPDKPVKGSGDPRQMTLFS